MTALIIAAIVAGVFVYAVIGAAVSGVVERYEATHSEGDGKAEGLLAGVFWPVTIAVHLNWRIAGRPLAAIYYLARMSPEERRFAKDERRKHREQRVDLARAVVRRGGGR